LPQDPGKTKGKNGFKENLIKFTGDRSRKSYYTDVVSALGSP